MRDVDVIAFPDMPYRTGRDSQIAELEAETLGKIVSTGKARKRSMLHKRALDSALKIGIAPNFGMNPEVAKAFAILGEKYGQLPPVRYYGHHLAHAAAAYLTSGFDDAAIVTLDGRGGPLSGATWRGRKSKIEKLEEEPYTNSLGWFYRDCTRYAGLGDFGEGKLMGLAPYGDASAEIGRMNRLIDTVEARWFDYRDEPSPQSLSFERRDSEEVLEQQWPHFAAAAQHALERGYERAVRSAKGGAHSNNLCLGGGVAMNCSANGRFLSSGVAESVWLFPASGDAGLSVGAALLAARDLGESVASRVESPYWGPSFDDEECGKVLLEESGLSFSRPSDLSHEVAVAIANGQVVGWFQGRMEIGPRALGNRSILADPRTIAMRDKVNRIKGREMWRPLAPSILAERTSDWFEVTPPNAFMLFAIQSLPVTRDKAPAIVHVDGSARPQPVTRELNARYYDLIAEFERLTTIPILLNTSFNQAGEPIVCTPRDAIRTFKSIDLDMLVLGSFVVRKKP